ncbi:hypothetical protein AX14_004529 [Amanita brunnescens Koide BX004]|nr:hypothetical protein AX14_004529 [Amanita brunnescens Koide BX004]
MTPRAPIGVVRKVPVIHPMAKEWTRSSLLTSHRFFVSYHHHPPSLSTLSPPPAFSDPPFLSANNTLICPACRAMAPGSSWTTMRRKSPSSSRKPSSRAPPPPKILSPIASPTLLSLSKDSPLPPALSALPSGARARPTTSENLWDDYPDSHWKIDNDIFCDSMGCSYDVNKNPHLATVAATVIEFDDCSYQEYEDTLFLCKVCNISCRRSINKSKIKSKMPLDDFLRRQCTEDDSFSPEATGLPLPPPSAADSPPWHPMSLTRGLPQRSLPQNLPRSKKLPRSQPCHCCQDPGATYLEDSRTSRDEDLTRTVESGGNSPASVSPSLSPVPNVIPSASPDRAPSPVTPILAVATLQVAHSNACRHDLNTCAICRVGITCCECCIMYTAPGTKRMRCSACLHWACDLDDNEACCSCGFLWIPKPHPYVPCDADRRSDKDRPNTADSPPPPPLPQTPGHGISSAGILRPAACLYGGAPSIGSTDDDEGDNSSASAKDDDTIRPVIPLTLPPFPMSSADEIDAFAQTCYDESRPTSAAAIRKGDTTSHYGFENKAIEDLTWSSTPEPADAIPGYKHSDWPDAILQCDDEDAYHFIKRGDADISKITDELDALMSGDTSWKTMFHAINDCFQFNTIRGSPEEFMCMLSGWCDPGGPEGSGRTLSVSEEEGSGLGGARARLQHMCCASRCTRCPTYSEGRRSES